MHFNFAGKTLATLFATSLLLVGCGEEKAEEGGETKNASQVAARVNGTELTVHQVNFLLQRTQGVGGGDSKALSEQVLRTLVDQEVAVQQALKDKLDRDPQVVQAMDAARRQILGDAYLARKLGTPVAPTDAEIADYYKKNPEFFAERKVYQLQELAIRVADEAKKQVVRAKLAEAKNLQEFADWLKAENIEFRGGQGVKAAEQLPRQIVPALAKVPNGKAVIVNAPDGLMVLIVAGTRAQPVAEDKAKPVIAQLLTAEKRQAAVKAEIDALKAAAKVEYLGEFANAGKVAAPVAPAAAAKPAEAGDAINKGLSGL